MINEVWLNEPDRCEFEYRGVLCLIIRHKTLGHLCGFTGIPEDSRYYDMSPLDITFKVHGGVTVSYTGLTEDYKDDIYYKPMLDNNGKKLKWFGFDCGHENDLSPIPYMLIDKKFNFFDENKIYRDFDYVMEQLKGLVDQFLINP